MESALPITRHPERNRGAQPQSPTATRLWSDCSQDAIAEDRSDASPARSDDSATLHVLAPRRPGGHRGTVGSYRTAAEPPREFLPSASDQDAPQALLPLTWFLRYAAGVSP